MGNFYSSTSRLWFGQRILSLFFTEKQNKKGGSRRSSSLTSSSYRITKTFCTREGVVLMEGEVVELDLARQSLTLTNQTLIESGYTGRISQNNEPIVSYAKLIGSVNQSVDMVPVMVYRQAFEPAPVFVPRSLIQSVAKETREQQKLQLELQQKQQKRKRKKSFILCGQSIMFTKQEGAAAAATATTAVKKNKTSSSSSSMSLVSNKR